MVLGNDELKGLCVVGDSPQQMRSRVLSSKGSGRGTRLSPSLLANLQSIKLSSAPESTNNGWQKVRKE